MKLDVSRYAGKNVTITVYVMTEDKKIRMGLETDASVQLLEVDAVPEDWTELSINYTIPEDVPAAYIYLETDGAADFYVDDISVVIGEDGAAAAEETESVAAGDNDASSTNDADGAESGNAAGEAGDHANGAASSGDEDGTSDSTGGIAAVVVALTAGGAWYAKKKSQNKKEGE